jgi:diacylglycerol kinase (ATP)
MKPADEPGFLPARIRSVRFALRGIATLIRTQPNARIHLVATILVIVAGLALRVGAGEWALLACAIGIVWTAEAANTALEALANRVTTDVDPQIRRAKDIAAGSVLLGSITAAAIGLLVLGPRLWALIVR